MKHSLFAVTLCLALASCGDDVTTDETPDPPDITILINPQSQTIVRGGSMQFGASVDASQGVSVQVVWSVNPTAVATVTQAGLVSVPTSSTPGATTQVCATSVANSEAKGCSTVTVGN